MADRDTPIDADQMMTAEEIQNAWCEIECYLTVEQTCDLLNPLVDTASAGLYQRDCLEQKRAYYAQRDQRQREALKRISRGQGTAGAQSFGYKKIACEALDSHPADTDASKFVEKIQREIMLDWADWALGSGTSREFSREGVNLFLKKKGIPIDTAAK